MEEHGDFRRQNTSAPPPGGMHVLDGYLSGAHLCAVHTGPVGRLSGRVVGDVGTGWGPVSGRS